MNEVLKNIQAHKSIRHFKKQEVEEHKLNAILEAATRASSSGNMQAYSIIVTRDPEMKKKMYKAHFSQEMYLEASLFLTFCADFRRMRSWLNINDAPMNFDNPMSFMISAIDAVLAAQTAALAAESLGLGLCYMGTTLASALEIGPILKCPKNVVPVVGFVLGYPDEKPKHRDRLPLESIVHQETYYEQTPEEIELTYKEKAKEGMKRYLSHPELASAIKASKVKNLAQVYTQIKYTRESHLKYSKDLIDYLREQNFLSAF